MLKPPPAWNRPFAATTEDTGLPGFTVFSEQDAHHALERLLDEGHVARGKRAAAAGGNDQFLLETPNDLKRVWDRVSTDELQKLGLVVEANMRPGFNVIAAGQTLLNGIQVSFAGSVRELPAQADQRYFGGTDVVLTRGGFDSLTPYFRNDNETLNAIQKIAGFHNNARQHLGLIASRSAYTVLSGTAHNDKNYSGVLEQSWRIGGSSGPEILAIQAFQDDPSLQAVNGVSRNLLGADATAPPNARVHYRGDDSFYGPVTVYSCIRPIGQD